MSLGVSVLQTGAFFIYGRNFNGYYFPISPNHMLLIAKGSDPVNVVSYRMADKDLIKKFNRVISSHSSQKIVSIEKDRSKKL